MSKEENKIIDLTDKQSIDLIWSKGTKVEGYNPDLYRKDAAGAWIAKDDYGKNEVESDLAWEIDHIYPRSKGGQDHLENLRPMHVRNNRSKGNDYPVYYAEISAADDSNIVTSKKCTVAQHIQAILKSLYNL